ncbi:CPK16, partial [Symbiodinium sp. KB8]
APKFLTKLRDTRGTPTSGPYQGRMEGDLVLQNGEGIFTLQLGFPFRNTLTISAAGWTRAQISWKGDEIVATNYVEVGIKLPKVPGLTNIMEYFVKSYGTQSTQDCTDALARAAEVARPPETPLQIVEEKVKELFTPLTGPEPEEAETQPETDAVDPEEVGLTLPSIAEAEPAPPEEQASSEDPLPPVVPGMEEANLVVRVKIDPKRRLVEDLGAEGAENLMAGSNRQILE